MICPLFFHEVFHSLSIPFFFTLSLGNQSSHLCKSCFCLLLGWPLIAPKDIAKQLCVVGNYQWARRQISWIHSAWIVFSTVSLCVCVYVFLFYSVFKVEDVSQNLVRTVHLKCSRTKSVCAFIVFTNCNGHSLTRNTNVSWEQFLGACICCNI